jgi:probable DNA repair protein
LSSCRREAGEGVSVTAGPQRTYAWLDDAIASEAEIVTANRRLARELLQRYAEAQIERGRTAWQTPPILYWRDWLGRKFDASASPDRHPRRLDRPSASILWERCLAQRMPAGLLAFGGVVRQAEQAWQRVIEWQVPLSEVRSAAGTQDERMFAAAAGEFRDLLVERRWVERSQLAGAVGELLRGEPELANKRVVFAGFDRLTPAAERIIEALTASGSDVSLLPPAKPAGTVAVASFDTEVAELRAAGAWAREILAGNGAARVGIVCPGLESAADRFGRVICEGLAPGWQFAAGNRASPVNISYGRRLSEYPMIAIALLALRWICGGLPGREVSVLLRSRSFGTGAIGDRSRLELRLRQYPDRAWTAGGLLAALSGSREASCAEYFHETLRTVDGFYSAADEHGSPIACARRIDEFLAAVGWPGTETLDSAGYQLMNRWRELLNEFARISSVQPSMRLAEAISRLAGMAGDTVWQAETDAGPVQVLGLLEAAGLEFDHLWISGMDASQWPPPSRPTPFLSNTLQRKYGIPDASPDATLDDAWAVTRRLLGSAGDAVVSWSRHREDSEVTPSPLLSRLDTSEYTGPGDPGWTIRSAAGLARTETIVDDAGPAVAADEKVRGGAYTVQKQHVEPFRAFVEGRLGVRRADPFSNGLSASQRGEITHSALHNLLSEKPSQQQLMTWTPEDRIRRAGAAIDAALAPHQRYADAVLQRLMSIERARLQQLLQNFIDAELKRPPFEVASLEESIELDRRGVRLGLRVDRIDTLADGRLVIIDYKTGQPASFRNRDGHLTEVQLVVYALAIEGDIGGIAYVNLDSRRIHTKAAGAGWGVDEQGWEETLTAWREVVDVAIRGLAAGDLRINLLQTTTESRPLAILSRSEEQRRAD